jgi:FAD:protein FMN transferase
MIAALLYFTAAAAAAERFEFREPHMGTMFRIVLYAESREGAELAAREAFARVRQLDETLSDYRDDSELMRALPRAATGWVPVSVDLGRALAKSIEIGRISRGAFDITIAPLTTLWRKARKEGALPRSEQIAETRKRVGLSKIQFRDGRLKLLSDARIDFGGIGKGIAVDAAIEVLRSRGITRALVAGSGDIRALDPPPGKPGWKVGLAGNQDYVYLRNQAISTSGDTEQFVEIAGKKYSHIVDPCTGLGVTHRRLVTVIARDSATADALATAWSLRDFPFAGALRRVVDGGRVVASPGFPKGGS